MQLGKKSTPICVESELATRTKMIQVQLRIEDGLSTRKKRPEPRRESRLYLQLGPKVSRPGCERECNCNREKRPWPSCDSRVNLEHGQKRLDPNCELRVDMQMAQKMSCPSYKSRRVLQLKQKSSGLNCESNVHLQLEKKIKPSCEPTMDLQLEKKAGFQLRVEGGLATRTKKVRALVASRGRTCNWDKKGQA